MPARKIRAFPPVFSAAQAVVQGLGTAVWGLLSDILDSSIAMLKAFPNLLTMADIASRLLTSIAGRLIAVPLRGYGELFAVAARNYYGSRVMRVEDCVRLIFRIPEEGLQFVTMTDETGFTELLVTGFAQWIYRTFKKFRMLRMLLIGWKEERFVETCVEVVAKKLKYFRFLFFLAVIVGILAVEIVAAAYIFTFCLSLSMWKGTVDEYILPQDSKRQWRAKGGVARVNARRGPDS